MPSEIIDLGALVTEDLPDRVWGTSFMRSGGYTESNSFNVIHWPLGEEGDQGSNAYYTLFNHGGPHVDAPNHIGLDGGLDSYPVEAFSGPLKVFDVSSFPSGRSIPVDVFLGQQIMAGDVIAIYTNSALPTPDQANPITITLTQEAANYLAEIPIRAFVTDSWSVYNFEAEPVAAATELGRLAPIHSAFLSRGIPIYEQMFNVESLLGKENMFFSGVPLNVAGGDGMIVRPVVFVY